MSTEKVFVLAQPFDYRGTTYTQFEARRPRVKDLRDFLRNIEKDSVNAIERVLSNLFEVDEQVIAEIDLEDFGPMKQWFESFLRHINPESNE